MSDKKNSKKINRQKKRRIAAAVIAIILAVAMVVPLLVVTVSAAEVGTTETAAAEAGTTEVGYLIVLKTGSSSGFEQHLVLCQKQLLVGRLQLSAVYHAAQRGVRLHT